MTQHLVDTHASNVSHFMFQSPLRAAAGCLLLFLLTAPQTSAQITTNTALPVTQGQGILRVQSNVMQATADGPTDRALTAYGLPLVGVYGVTPQWQIDVSPAYQVNTEANNFKFGDEARLDIASKYRLWKNDQKGSVPGFFYANLETNLIWQGKNELRGQDAPNSGGTTWLVAPGLQYITRQFVIEGAMQLPAAQAPNGTALEEDVLTTLSVRRNI